MPVDPKHQSITYPCPTCRHGKGRPRSVACHDGRKIVHLVCDRCEHAWDDISMNTAALFQPPSMAGGPDPLV
jgi:hypothetical protein